MAKTTTSGKSNDMRAVRKICKNFVYGRTVSSSAHLEIGFLWSTPTIMPVFLRPFANALIVYLPRQRYWKTVCSAAACEGNDQRRVLWTCKDTLNKHSVIPLTIHISVMKFGVTRRAFLKRPENFSGPKAFRGSFRVIFSGPGKCFSKPPETARISFERFGIFSRVGWRRP